MVNLSNSTPSSSSPTSTGIIIPLLFFSTIGLLGFILFCLVRNKFKDLFHPKKSNINLSDSTFTWITQIINVSETTQLHTIGLDGIMFLKFLKMSANLFTLLAIPGLFILLPVNYHAGKSVLVYEETVFLKKLTVENVPQGSTYLIIHLLFLWIASFLSYSFLINFYKTYNGLKLDSVLANSAQPYTETVQSRTIMVYNIPTNLRNESRIQTYFKRLNIGNVESVTLCQDYSVLLNAISKRSQYLKMMESVFHHYTSNPTSSFIMHLIPFKFMNIPTQSDDTSLLLQTSSSTTADPTVSTLLNLVQTFPISSRLYIRNGLFGLFGDKVECAKFYCEKFQVWDSIVTQMRQDTHSYNPNSTAFVTFKSIKTALVASQINIASRPYLLLTKDAPEPRDINWSTLDSFIGPFEKLARSIAVYSLMFIMVFFNTIVVSSIASLIDLDSLSVMIPFLKDTIDNIDPNIRQIIQGVIPTGILALWTSLMPLLLFWLSQFQGFETLSSIEMSVMSKYFFYQIWNILLVVISSVIFKSAAWPINNPKDIIEILGNSLPRESPTLINYVILQAFAALPLQILQAGPLFATWITRLPFSTRTPRQYSDAYSPSTLLSINYGISYSVPMLLFVVGLTYAPIAPLIIPICALFFHFGHFIFKYLLLFVHVPQYENNGRHAMLVVRRCIFGLFLMQLTMMGVLALKSVPSKKTGSIISVELFGYKWSNYVLMVVLVTPLLISTLTLFWWLKHGYERNITHTPLDIFDEVVAMQESQSDANDDTIRVYDECEGFLSGLSDELFLDRNHLEPPMSRIHGILDAVSTKSSPESNAETFNIDMQLYSYVHPAIIGKLPIAWYKGDNFDEQRRDQTRKQREAFEYLSMRPTTDSSEISGQVSLDNYQLRSSNFTSETRVKSLFQSFGGWIESHNG